VGLSLAHGSSLVVPGSDWASIFRSSGTRMTAYGLANCRTGCGQCCPGRCNRHRCCQGWNQDALARKARLALPQSQRRVSTSRTARGSLLGLDDEFRTWLAEWNDLDGR
jgi:hypothetical protein